MMLDEDFEEWINAHRVFTQDEVLKGSWLKISDLLTVREARLSKNGTLIENDLFNPHSSWEGTWRITSGVLVLSINEYVLSIYAAKNGIMHSGVEVFQGKSYAYFKVIHLV